MDDQQPCEVSEAIVLSEPDASSARTRRVRAVALITALALLAGIMGAVAITTSDDDRSTIDASPTVTTSATADVASTATTRVNPGPSIGARPPSAGPDFQNVRELTRATLSSGEIVRFIETNDRRYLCSVVGTLPGPGTQCIDIGSMPPQSGGPQINGGFGWSANGAIYLGFVPAGFADDFIIRDDEGTVIPFGRSTSGAAFLLLDPVQPSTPAPNRPPSLRYFELVDRNGVVLARLSAAAASLPPALPPTSPPSQLAACLRSKGLDVPDPSPGRPMTAYSPDTARVAWEGCRDLYVETHNIPASAIAQALAYPDCMAAQGWLVATSTGPPPNSPAYDSAHQKCDPRFQFINCLRLNGLDVPDPPTTSPSMTPVRLYPIEAARAAWQSCRDTYARLTSIPEDRVALVLALADCMAGHGWIIVVGPPADKVQHDAALQRCDRALVDSVAGSFASSDITLSEGQCIGGRLVALLGAPRVVDHNLARGGWSLLGVALSAEWERTDAEKTVDAFAACAQNWKLLLIKTATEGTDRMSDVSAVCVANGLSDSDGRTIFIEELDRADPSLGYLTPLLAEFDKCLTPEELDRIDWD